MTKRTFSTILILSALTLLFGCGKSIGVVDAGAYPGTIDKVVPAEQEIYVTLDGGERLELYFTDSTQLVRGGSQVAFDQLSEGAQVTVTVEREGNRNIPTRVEIGQ